MPKTTDRLDEIALFLKKPVKNSAEAAELLLVIIQESKNLETRTAVLRQLFFLVRDIPLLKLLDDPAKEEGNPKSAIPRSLVIAKAMVRIYLDVDLLKKTGTIQKSTETALEEETAIAKSIMLELFQKANDFRILYLCFMTRGKEGNVEFKGPSSSMASTPFDPTKLMDLFPELFVDCLIADNDLVPTKKKIKYFEYILLYSLLRLPGRSIYLIVDFLNIFPANIKSHYFFRLGNNFRTSIKQFILLKDLGKLPPEDVNKICSLAHIDKFLQQPLLHIASAEGNTKAMVKLAALKNSQENPILQEILYEKASEAGNSEAQYRHASALARNPANNEKVFRLASVSSDLRAPYILGSCFLTGRGTERDIDKGLAYFYNYLSSLLAKKEPLSIHIENVLRALSENLTHQNEVAFAKFIRKTRPIMFAASPPYHSIIIIRDRIISFEARYWIATLGNLEITVSSARNVFSSVPLSVKRLIKEDPNQFVKYLNKDELENFKVKQKYFEYIDSHKKLKALLNEENKQIVEQFLRPKTSGSELIKAPPPTPRL